MVACIQEGADNSTFSPDSPTTLHQFGDVLTYTCNTGYNHSMGDLVRTCQNDGEWTGVLPACPSKAFQDTHSPDKVILMVIIKDNFSYFCTKNILQYSLEFPQ